MSDTPRLKKHVVLAARGTGIVASSVDGCLAICGSKTMFDGVISATLFHDKTSNKWFVGAILISKHVVILELNQAGTSWSWAETGKHEMPKRLSSICFAESPFCAVVADTMGDVFRLPLQGNCNLREEKLQEKHLLLGHFSPVTDVSVAKDRMVTCDRDNKIRLSRFPDAHIIDDFLLGHSAFVTCVCWVSESRVMSGAGDGTLRVWDLELDKQCVVHLSEKKNADKTVVTSLEISPKNRELVVAVVHEDPDVHILHFLQLSSDGTLRTLPMSSQPVTGACFDDDGILWVSVDGEESVTGYSLELRHEALRLSQCSPSTAILPEDDADLVENEEEDNDTSSNETLRSKWLLQLRKKPIVENWKGKKRKSADC